MQSKVHLDKLLPLWANIGDTLSTTSTTMNGFFIVGTDTGVGKTRITAALLRAFLEEGHNALAVKPVQTGCTATSQGLEAEDGR